MRQCGLNPKNWGLFTALECIYTYTEGILIKIMVIESAASLVKVLRPSDQTAASILFYQFLAESSSLVHIPPIG